MLWNTARTYTSADLDKARETAARLNRTNPLRLYRVQESGDKIELQWAVNTR